MVGVPVMAPAALDRQPRRQAAPVETEVGVRRSGPRRSDRLAVRLARGPGGVGQRGWGNGKMHVVRGEADVINSQPRLPGCTSWPSSQKIHEGLSGRPAEARGHGCR